MKKRMLALLLGGMLLLSGCGGTGGGQAPRNTERNGRSQDLTSRLKAQTVPEETLSTGQAEAVNAFSVRLLQQCQKDGNTLVSPLSVLAALGMTANGAAGETLAQMEAALGLSAAELNRYLHVLTANLPAEEDCAVHLANAIWLRDDPFLTVEEPFLQTCKDYYDAGVYTAPFDGTTVEDINGWVQKNTAGMIDNILDKISEDAMLYLVNALSFDAEWSRIYTEYQVQEGVFTAANGQKRNVEFLHRSENNYLRDENAQGFYKTYAGERYAFAALLPEEGTSLQDYVAGLTGERLKSILENISHEEVITSLPKFETEFSVELSQALEAMGMTDAFSARADFSPLGHYENENLSISRVCHKTRITVDERGTKAGAATSVEIALTSARPVSEPKTVCLDRPFVYLLIDLETGTPLFLGTLLDPEA